VNRVGVRPAAAVRRVPLIALAIAGAWVVMVAAQLSGHAGLLHHHTLIEAGPSLWLGVPIFLVGWLVMIAAMMLPASLPAVAAYAASAPSRLRSSALVSGFLAPYTVVWALFGLLAFDGDFGLHHLVYATPWLGARPWLIDAGVLGLAGAWQLTPLKRRCLEACRHPESSVAHEIGLSHALACLGSSGALMLLMFAEGFASLTWMAVLAVVMGYEAIGRHGFVAARVVGVGLLALATAVLATGVSV
jgi:predicted metal-binding membrane protein